MQLTTEQKQQLETIYHHYFNGSKIRYAQYENRPYMWARFYLAADTSELINDYWTNDCFNLDFEINSNGATYTLQACAKSYTIKPIFHPYNCYDRRVVAFRKVSGSWEKILDGFDKFFKRLHEQFISDLDSDIIPDQTYTNVSHKKIGELRVVR